MVKIQLSFFRKFALCVPFKIENSIFVAGKTSCIVLVEENQIKFLVKEVVRLSEVQTALKNDLARDFSKFGSSRMKGEENLPSQ